MALVGYTVEATDGRIGAIDRRTYANRQTAVFIAGEDGNLLKADLSTVERIDHRNQRVYLTVSRRDLTPG